MRGTDLSEYLHGPEMIRPGRPRPLTGQAPPVVLGHMAKLHASEVAMQVAGAALQSHGGYGCVHEYPIGRFSCDAKILDIDEGTNEIQRLVIARELRC